MFEWIKQFKRIHEFHILAKDTPVSVPQCVVDLFYSVRIKISIEIPMGIENLLFSAQKFQWERFWSAIFSIQFPNGDKIIGQFLSWVEILGNFFPAGTIFSGGSTGSVTHRQKFVPGKNTLIFHSHWKIYLFWEKNWCWIIRNFGNTSLIDMRSQSND